MEWALNSSMSWCLRKDLYLYYTKKFFVSEASRLAVWVLAGAVFAGVRQWMREADHLPSARIILWCSASTVLYAVVLWHLIKHRNNLILAFEVCSLWNKRGMKALQQIGYSLCNWTICCSKDYSGVWLHVFW